MILFGGESEKGFLNDLWVFDLKTKQWEEVLALGAYPGPRKGHSCSIFSLDSITLLAIFGGNSLGKYSNDLYLIKLQLSKSSVSMIWITNEFKSIGKSPSNREGHSIIQNHNSVLLIGGCNYQLSTCFGDIFNLTVSVFPAKTIEWQEINAEIFPQEKTLSLYINNQIFLLGGHATSNKPIKTSKIIDCNKKFFESENNKNFVIKANVLPTETIFIQDQCVHNCRNRGSCLNGVCSCLPLYFGNSCEFKHCSSSCGEEENRGVCNHETGSCDCQNTFGGEKCQ